MPKPETYTHYAVQSFLSAPGWQAVYWDDNAHVAWEVPLLAHVQERTYNARTRQRIPSGCADDELWDISGVMYMPSDVGWSLCIEDNNFCGLLSPGATLEAFLKDHDCLSRPRQAPVAR